MAAAWVVCRGSAPGGLRDGGRVRRQRESLERAIAFLLLEPGEQDGEDEQHARSADRKRRGPRPALEPRDDAARQDGRNIHPLPDRRLDGLGRAEQRMIRAQDRTPPTPPTPCAREVLSDRRLMLASRSHTELRSGTGVWSWHTHQGPTRLPGSPSRLVCPSNQVVERQTAAVLRAEALTPTEPSSRQLRRGGHQRSGLTASSRTPVASASLG